LSTLEYLFVCAGYTAYMTLLWRLRRPLRNAGLVDFGWPTGLVVVAVYFYATGDGWTPRKAVLCGMFAFCGLRFMLGWGGRTARYGEDRRWDFWRRHWRDGRGPFGIRSADINFLIYYHAQTFTTLLVGAAPLGLSSHNEGRGFRPLEMIAVALWLAA